MYKYNNLSIAKHHRKRLRKEQTKAEKILWGKLRNKQLGYKFRRQHSFGKYILDFYSPTLLLGIEVDGSIHGRTSQKTHDEIRTKYLEDNLITMIRFRNEKIYKELDSVVVAISSEIKKQEVCLLKLGMLSD